MYFCRENYAMMKRWTFFALAVLFSFSAMAQNGINAVKRNGDFRFHLVGTTGLTDVVQLVSREAPYHLGLGGMLEYKPWKAVGLGLGAEWASDIGYQAYEGVVGNSLYATYLPVYANVRVAFGGNESRFFFSDTRLGYAFPLKNKDLAGFVSIVDGYYSVGGLFGSMGIGYASGRSTISAGVELKTYRQWATQADWEDWEREALEGRFLGDNMLTFNGYLRYSYAIVGRKKTLPSDWSAAHLRTRVAPENHYFLYLYGGLGALDWIWDVVSVFLIKELIPMHYHIGTMFDMELGRGWSLGAGTELHGSFGLRSVFGANDNIGLGLSTRRSTFLSLPVYGNVKWGYEFEHIKPFVEMRLGYAFPVNTVHLQDIMMQYSEAPDNLGVHGDAQAKGFFTGMGVGIEAFGHNLSLGMTAMNVEGVFVNDYYPDEKAHIGSRMTNFYIRYAYALKFGKKENQRDDF